MAAMKFGGEEDFKIAITELKWIIDTFGKATKKDFEVVSSKYNFPVGFLKQKLNGLAFPDDYRISKSKWFPILFSWISQKKEASYKLFRLKTDYLSSRFSIIRTFAILIGIFQVIIIFLENYLALDLLNLALLVTSFALFLVGLFFEMRDPVIAKKMALDEYCHMLRQRGLEKIIEENDRFIKKHYRSVIYAGNILKKKLESAPQITVFAYHMENGELHLDDWENSVLEYKRRISQLEL